MTPRVERILVGVDGSSNARRALDWAILIGQQFSAQLVVVHAVGLLTHLGAGAPVPSQSHLDELRHAFESIWCAPLADAGLEHRRLLVDGSPVRVLLDAAEREQVDVVVVGSRGFGGFAELLLGSTSSQVAQHSTRPVLIVPPGSADTGR
jgi:nucleotide-binding universal stress UspA family protein